MVNTTENDILGYELALAYVTERGDAAAAALLQRNGPPPYTGAGMLDRYVAYLDILNDYMNAPRYTLVVPIVPFLAPEYGLIDKVNHTRGLVDSFPVVYPQLKDLDFMVQAPRLEVPVYIFVGRDDVNAMASLVEEYHNALQAPHNELIWLEGGHGLNGNNLGHFTDVVVNTILPQTYPPAAASSAPGYPPPPAERVPGYTPQPDPGRQVYFNDAGDFYLLLPGDWVVSEIAPGRLGRQFAAAPEPLIDVAESNFILYPADQISPEAGLQELCGPSAGPAETLTLASGAQVRHAACFVDHPFMPRDDYYFAEHAGQLIFFRLKDPATRADLVDVVNTFSFEPITP
jgi:hypothetical protein